MQRVWTSTFRPVDYATCQIFGICMELHGVFKFRKDKSNNLFCKILKCFRNTSKFKFFEKQIIYLESPDHPPQNDM